MRPRSASGAAPPAASTASTTRAPAGSRWTPGLATAPTTWTTTSVPVVAPDVPPAMPGPPPATVAPDARGDALPAGPTGGAAPGTPPSAAGAACSAKGSSISGGGAGGAISRHPTTAATANAHRPATSRPRDRSPAVRSSRRSCQVRGGSGRDRSWGRSDTPDIAVLRVHDGASSGPGASAFAGAVRTARGGAAGTGEADEQAGEQT